MLEAAMRKLLCLQLRPIFAPNKPPPEENQSEKAIGATLSLPGIRKRLTNSKVVVLSYFWPSLTKFVLKGRKFSFTKFQNRGQIIDNRATVHK